MLCIGLTGGIASGKSTVTEYFRELGVDIIDTDIIARELVAVGQPALDEITHAFGKGILNKNSGLDRSKLREIIFHDPVKRKQLEAILHPRIRKQVFAALQKLDAPYTIVVVPLLFETDYPYPLDRVIVMDTTADIQLKRLLSRDDMNEITAKAIIAAQLTAQKRAELADDILNNDNDLATLKTGVEKLHHQYLMLANSCT